MDQQPQPPEGIEPIKDWGIDMSMLIAEWETSRQYTKHHTSDFKSLDMIVDGVPITPQTNAPYVGDTTLAGLVRSIPRQSLQQLPIFGAVINGTKNSINAQIASYVLRHAVFNQNTFGKGLLATMQIGGEQALTHGFAPFMCATGTMFSEFGTTMRLLHYSDVGVEPGVSDAYESGFFYVSANLTKSRVKKIRAAAANNPNTTWNVAALDRLCEMQPQTNNYSIFQSDPKYNPTQDAPTYQFVTRYEVGKKGKFVIFCPQIEDEPLRVLQNRSKFGYPRVQFLVIDPAALTPFGVSRVRLASPNQNLMNAYYQNVAAMFILNSDPPTLQRGRFTKPVQLKRGAKWVTLDQNATVELKEMSNGTLQQFVPMAQQMAAQIQNMMGSPTGTLNGNSNAMGFSKTAPGVKMQQQASDVSANQITNLMEGFLREYALVALDTYISEQTVDEPDPENPNEDTLILDDEAKTAINRIAPGTVGDDNKIVVNWNEFYDSIETWSVEIELSIGKDELEEKKRGDLQDMLTVLMQNADPADVETQTKIRELTDRLMEKSVPESQRLSATPAPAQMTPPVPGPAETQVGD